MSLQQAPINYAEEMQVFRGVNNKSILCFYRVTIYNILTRQLNFI